MHNYKKKNNSAFRQAGFSLLDLMLSMAIMGTLTVSQYQQKIAEIQQVEAHGLGVELYQYNNAVRQFIAKSSPTSDGTVTHHGTKWLKNQSCGGSIPNSESPFLSCTFPDKTKLGNMSYTTTITYKSVGTGDNKHIEKTANTVVFGKHGVGVPLKGGSRQDLAGVAAMVGSSGSIVSNNVTIYNAAGVPTPTPVKNAGVGMSTDGYMLYCVNIKDKSKLRPECQGAIDHVSKAGHIIMSVANYNDNDVWLRRDGGNKMNADLKFDLSTAAGGASPDYAINGFSRLIPRLGMMRFINPSDPTAPVTLIGNLRIAGSGLAVAPNTQFNSQVSVGGKLEANSDLTVKGVTTLGDASHDTKILGGLSVYGSTALNGDLVVKKKATFKDHVVLEKGITVTKDSVFEGKLDVGGKLTAKSGIDVNGPITDADDPTYSIDPNQTSKFNTINAKRYELGDSGWALDSNMNLNYNSGTSSITYNLPESLMMDIGTVKNGEIIEKPQCAKGYAPRIYTAISQVTSNQGSPLGEYSIQSYADTINSHQWQVWLRYYGYSKSGPTDTLADSLGWVKPDGIFARIQVITRCINMRS